MQMYSIGYIHDTSSNKHNLDIMDLIIYVITGHYSV